MSSDLSTGNFHFFRNFSRVYLKTPNAPGQRAFLRCAASFFLEIRQYSCEKMSCATQKSLAAGHIVSFQIHPKKTGILRRDRVHDHLRRHYESRIGAHVVEHDQLENHFKLLRHRPSGRSGARHCHVFLPVVDCRTHARKARPGQD